MLRFGFNQFGGPDVFTELTAVIPEPKQNQVQIKVAAFGINPYDLRLRQGDFADSRTLPMPIVPGTELAGTVTAVGSDVTDYQIGDRVLNYRPRGAYSQFVTASTTKIAHLPADMSLTTAAALPNVGIAAFGVLQLLQVQPGKTIVIEGASGGVGSILVQAAKYLGLRVIATCSSANHELVLELGADEVGLYDRENVGARFANMGDYVVNATAGGHDNNAGIWMRRPNGVYVTLNEPDVRPEHDPDFHVLGEQRVDTQAAFAFLFKLFNHADLQVHLARTLPFSVTGVIAAHTELAQHHPAGKYVCTATE